MSHIEARQSWGKLRGRTPSWTRQIEAMTTAATSAPTPESRVQRALTLLHTAQIAFAAANAFAVRVIRPASDDAVELQYVPTTEADEISKSLGLESPLARLKETLDLEKFGESEGWVLSEAARLVRPRREMLSSLSRKPYRETRDPDFASGPRASRRFSSSKGILFQAGRAVTSCSFGVDRKFYACSRIITSCCKFWPILDAA
jgi:hypothetical protein